MTRAADTRRLLPALDPRRGDVEDDALSARRRSALSRMGTLLVEVSPPRLAAALILLLVVPGLVLGFASLAASLWIGLVSRRIVSPFAGAWPTLVLLAVLLFGVLAGRTLFRLAEKSFWSLNALAVQPIYTTCREALRHLAERLLARRAGAAGLGRLHAFTTLAAGLIASGLAVLVLLLAWPRSHWSVAIPDLDNLHLLVLMAIANATVLLAAYFAVAALVWMFADAAMPHPRDLEGFAAAVPAARTWRIAHLSDLHVVGERYGFRIESGRAGPCGNDRLCRTLVAIERVHRLKPLDAILVTGDLTDTGRSAEWAEFLDILGAHPALTARVLLLPGNHDLNIVDRANPARLELPISPNSRLRRIRALAAMDAVQGRRVRVVDQAAGRLGETLAAALDPHRQAMARFADCARPLGSKRLAALWARVFPLVMSPDRPDGLGVILLNSNAETHFSFTNALGLISFAQVRGIAIACAQYPEASWIIALHHHLVEYPWAARALSERIGTALVNGNWFLRRLRPLAGRALLMHGHRHIDWLGECAGLPIVSAPSPVMGAPAGRAPYFYVHTLAAPDAGHLRLLEPERIDVPERPQRATGGRAAGRPRLPGTWPAGIERCHPASPEG
ncbi:MAG: metallophosphoesterase [Rhodospirillales bacterium]|nr:metallophosphoesterase [Rhodospirillales bacterium]